MSEFLTLAEAVRRNLHGGDTVAFEGLTTSSRTPPGTVVVDTDEHPRADTTLEGLAKLPTPFRQGGSVTAGNASGVNDGGAALIVASEAAAKRHGLTPMVRILGGAAAGARNGDFAGQVPNG